MSIPISTSTSVLSHPTLQQRSPLITSDNSGSDAASTGTNDVLLELNNATTSDDQSKTNKTYWQRFKRHACSTQGKLYIFGTFGLASVLGILMGVLIGLEPFLESPADYYNNRAFGINLAYVPSGMVISWTTLTPIQNNATILLSLYNQTIVDNKTFDVNETNAAIALYSNNTYTNVQLITTNQSTTYSTATFYHLLIPNLQPNTRYIYQIMADIDTDTTHSTNNTIPASAVYEFSTAPIAGTDISGDEIVIVGDMGFIHSGDTVTRMINRINSTQFVFHTGDLSYADDWQSKDTQKYGNYDNNWNYWVDYVQPITSTLPYMVLPGNHEATCSEASYTSCGIYGNFTAYRHRMRMPSEESNATGAENMWYSFDYGMIHFIALNSESDFPNPPDQNLLQGASNIFPHITTNQTTWLHNDLASVNRSVTPFIVVGAHRSMYTSSSSEQDASANMRAAFEDILLQYNVTMYFNGHIHAYERVKPIANSIIQTSQMIDNNHWTTGYAPVYITNGAAGNIEALVAETPTEITAVYNDQYYGYGVLKVLNRTMLQWTYYDAANDGVVDQLLLENVSF